MADEPKQGIWLEVTDIRFETGAEEDCRVQLKGDREHPKPAWWPVHEEAAAKEENLSDTYKAILRELDRKRLVLARLSCRFGVSPDESGLYCMAFRFQAPDLGSR